MVHTTVYGSSTIATDFLFDRVWDTIPFLTDLILTTDGPLLRNGNSEGSRNITWRKNVPKCSQVNYNDKIWNPVLFWCVVFLMFSSLHFVMKNKKEFWYLGNLLNLKILLFRTLWLYYAHNEWIVPLDVINYVLE